MGNIQGTLLYKRYIYIYEGPSAKTQSTNVCMCVCVRSNLPPHTLESQNTDNTERLKKKGDLAKNILFKSYGIICSPRAAPAL